MLATGCNDPAAGSNVTFLHSDHLGRPKFATNADGDIVWDEGITTPFGIQITAMAAQTQALMFPGQYQDLETTGAGVTLSHNWHRTYDPMLGRYLQSDPIGLAGGLNRYAYVGGNPVSFVDPSGLILPLIVGGIITGAGVDFAGQVLGNIANGNPAFSNLDGRSILTAGVAGGLGGPAGALVKGVFGKAILSGAVTGAVFEFQQECATLESITEQALIGGILGGSFQKIGNGIRSSFRNLNNIKSSSNRNLMQPFSGPYADTAGNNIPPLVSIGGYTGSTAFNEARNR
ncbi:RHS repeat-associated core domain-containing protein [Hellea balneolensis]|uniref:RHS repeat-associated core domain-containing protein n=1 Tax=Hellea balneolensis TaxID=287478 RepID=UPI0003FC8A3A|nr:RHS repeat-associated core domain-containing protein [Hellea balneolensis]